MPQATDLVVKNHAAADKTFKLMTPAAGDGGIAIWHLKEGPFVAAFPKFTAMARPVGGPSKGRLVETKFTLPTVTTVEGNTLVGDAAEVKIITRLPGSFPEASRDDFVAYATNLFATALVKSMVRDGFGAN